MRRSRPSLRGSVSQGKKTVRLRARETTRLGFLIRIGIAASVFVVVTLLAIVGWHNGWFDRQENKLADYGLRLTQRAHFAVRDVVIEGRQHTDKDELLAVLDAPSGSPIFAFDPMQAQARIAKLPWVAGVTVERRLPDRILVQLIEREPLARWQHDNRTVVIDATGTTLADADPAQFAQLLLVVGAGAPAETKELLDMLRQFPAVAEKTTAAVRVGERRWDLHLLTKAVARMPETDLLDALKRLSLLITDQKILDRDVAAIDLRIPDRLIIESGTNPAPPHPDNRL